jgi:hypothetical protein
MKRPVWNEIYLYGRPKRVPSETWTLGTHVIPCWSLAEGPLPLSTSFEDIAIRMSSIRGLHFEPDGSFLWLTTDSAGCRYELSGTFFDNGDFLQYVDIHGSCEKLQWQRFLREIVGEEEPPSALVLGKTQKLIPAERMPDIWTNE